eukprot:2471079-Rhodomonas_salina.3
MRAWYRTRAFAVRYRSTAHSRRGPTLSQYPARAIRDRVKGREGGTSATCFGNTSKSTAFAPW